MKCKLCGGPAGPLPFAVPPEAGEWFGCRDCGSSSASQLYDEVSWIYHDRAYYDGFYAKDNPTLADLRRDCSSNCEWFAHHHELREKTFLDVGCWHGAAMDNMREAGWAVHGFDVSSPPFNGPHVTVAPLFSRWLFPRRFAAVLCREVIEHVPHPRLMLHELHGACLPGGLVQVQTPRAVDYYNDVPYQKQHLFAASERQMRKMLAEAMLDVIDSRVWGGPNDSGRAPGQAYLCRARK